MNCNKEDSIGSHKFLKIRHKFLNDSLIKQSLNLFLYAVIATVIATIALSFGNNASLFSTVFLLDAGQMLFYVGSFDGADAGTLSISSDFNRVSHILHTFSLILIVAIWQAVLIFKMMQTDEGIQLSNYITYYNYGVLKKDEKTSLVFRLMNDGFNTVYNVKITALLRIKPSKGPYRHYKLNVLDSEIASLEVGMPYSIYIDTGEIENVDKHAKFIDSGSIVDKYKVIKKYKEDKEGDEIKKLPLFHKQHKDVQEIPDETWIVVIIEAFDDFLDQINITKKVYDYHKVKEGRWENIESRLEQAEDSKDKKNIAKVKESIKNPENADKLWLIFDRDEVWSKFNQPFEQKEIKQKEIEQKEKNL
jgi:hypothetical protein